MSHTEIIEAGQSTLPELAKKINAQVEAAEGRARSALQYALDAGQLLNKAKVMVPHGKWNDWLVENCVVAPRTAQAYMRLAKSLPLLTDADAQRVADLPVREAIRAISTDPTPAMREAAAQPPRDREERHRVVEQFQKTAASIREASKWFTYGMDLKPMKVASLRKKLTDAIAELDRLQQDGGAA